MWERGAHASHTLPCSIAAVFELAPSFGSAAQGAHVLPAWMPAAQPCSRAGERRGKSSSFRTLNTRRSGSRCNGNGSSSSRDGRSPGRFAALSLGDWRLRLPKLTERGPAYDPWAADSAEAPRGVRRRGHGSTDSAAPLASAPQPSAPSAAATAGALPAAPVSQLPERQQPQQTAAPQQAASGHAGDNPTGHQRQRLHGSHSADGKGGASSGGGGLQAWLAQRMPRLPGSSELRNSLPLWLVLSPPGAPDKRRLMTVQDFFKYTEGEGALGCYHGPLHMPCRPDDLVICIWSMAWHYMFRYEVKVTVLPGDHCGRLFICFLCTNHSWHAGRAFFDELDRDGDGRIKSEDVKAALRARNLPERLAGDFIRSARGGRWWASTVE